MPDYWDQFAPADNNQDYWNQFQPADSGNNDYWGQFKEEKPDEQSWLDWGVTTGLRTAFPVAGSILGGIGGAALGGIGAVPGTMAGGAIGGGLGEAAAQWYEGKGFNPWSIGVEAGLGAIPLMGGKTPGLGSSLKEVGAYALRGAGEGAFMGGVGAVPRTFAQTGEYPTWQEVGSQALGGAAFGGLTSGVLGAGNVVREHYTPRLQKIADASYGEPITGDLFGADDVPINRSRADLPPIGGTTEWNAPRFDTDIHGTPSVPRTDITPNITPFSTGQIDPNAYMTLTRQLGRPPSMAEIEAFQSNVVPFTPRSSTETPIGPTGNVAPFLPTQVTKPADFWAAEKAADNTPPVDLSALQGFVDENAWLKGNEGGHPAWEESIDDMIRTGPTGIVPKTTFSDEDARRIVDRAFPPPAPEQPLPTEYGQNALDQEALQWMRNQDRIIGDYQASGRHLMEDEWGPITPGHAESLLPRPASPQQLGTGGIQVPGGELLPAEAKQSEFERLFGLQPGEQMSDAEIERIKQFYAKQLRDMYGTDVVEGSRASDEALGILGDEKLHYPELDDEPRFAKVKGGGLSIDVDNRRAGVNLTKDYTTELSGIMAREAIQNALDAVKDLGTGGRVHVRTLNKGRSSNTTGEPDIIEVYDNGKGLDETGLAEKLVRLFATGKENEAGATGGKGIGSASYILGGKHFQIETVSVDSQDGKKYRITAGGTPDQFYDTEQGSDWDKQEVPMSTPTGTKIRVKLNEGQELYNTNQMIDKILHHSRDREAKILRDTYGFSVDKDISAIVPDTTYNDVTENTIGASSTDKTIGILNYNDSDITVGVAPHDGKERNNFDVHYLNNGMYQFSETKYVDQKMKGVPNHVIVNIKPQMDEQDDNYPFINTREDVKKNMRNYVDEFIQKNITGPAVEKRKNRVQELYDSMPVVNIPNTARKTVIFDPGNRLTSEELDHIVNSPDVHALVQHWDAIIDNIIADVGRTKWRDRLEGVGLVLDPNMHGVHIPNPATKKSTILINPFIRAEQGQSPADNAFNNTITAIHEVAHIGDESGGDIDPTPMEMDMSDPRYAQFYQSYFQQMRDHGDVGWKNTGHGLPFMQRLGEVYAKVGAANTFSAADGLEQIFTGGTTTGEYSPEFQELLRIYTESRGRAETTEDLLSGTGVKQSNTTDGGEGQVPGNAGLLGGRIIRAIDPNAVAKAEGFQRIAATTGDARLKKAADEIYLDQAANITLEFLKNHGYAAFNKLMSDERGAINIPAWKDIKKAAGWGQGRNSPALNRAVFKYIDEALSASKNIVTVGDVSFPGRQGLGAIGTQQFWGAIYNMFGGMTQAGYDRIDAEIRNLPAFRPGPLNPRTGQRGPSFAEQIGVDLYTQPSKAGAHHHSIASRWLETGEFLGPAAPLWKHSPAGKWFRASNRVNLTFMNYLRANRLQYMLDRAQDMSLSALQGNKVRPNIFSQQFDITTQAGRDEAMELDPYRNLVLAREIADSVRTMTGGAPLRTHALPLSGTELSGESAAGIFNRIFFSPGLMASRVRTLNPSTYIMATPQVRRNYLQTLLGTAMGWTAGLALMKMYYGDQAQIGTDPRSADFGKAVIGDFRVDPGASNQQWLVLAARIASGTPVSSSTNREYRLGEGFNATTAWDLGVNFLGNKLEPTAKLAFDMARASGYQPVHMKDRTMQLFIPLVAQDLIELSKKRPDLAPMALASFFGMGTQIYDRGASESKFFDPKDDWLYQGGGLQGLIQGTNFRGPDDTSRASRAQSRSRASRGSGRSSTR